MDSRNDERTREAVHEGLKIDVEKGTVRAWVFMMKSHIPAEVIMRVLAFSERRKEDPPAMTTAYMTTNKSPRISNATPPSDP